MWEDARNKKGGRWLVNWEKKDRRDIADSLWEETVSLYDVRENPKTQVSFYTHTHSSCCLLEKVWLTVLTRSVELLFRSDPEVTN